MTSIENIEIYELYEQVVSVKPLNNGNSRVPFRKQVLGVFTRDGKMYLRCVVDSWEEKVGRLVYVFTDGEDISSNNIEVDNYVGTCYIDGYTRHVFTE